MDKKPFAIILALFFASLIQTLCFAQEMTTVDEYFDNVSKIYGKVSDYKAQIVITQDKSVMKGTIYYKSPNLLRIDFSDPRTFGDPRTGAPEAK